MIVVEVFSCAGGFSEGLRRAGLSVTLAFDWDPDACDSYEANLGRRPIAMDARDVLRMARAGWSPGPIDLAVFDPPCTPWSCAGKRLGVDDPRDMLEVSVELVRALRPRAYLLANVPGLDTAPNLPVVQQMIGGLADCGYCPADFVRLDAADYGVPQHCVRSFGFGHLDGPCVQWPERTHGSPEETAHAPLPGVERLRPWITCRQALGHLARHELGEPVRLRWQRSADHRPSRLDEPAKTLTTNSHSDGALLLRLEHPIHRQDAPSYAIATEDRGEAAGGHVIAWPWDRPATTVTRGERIPLPGHHEGVTYMSEGIKISERAAALLQGFPDGWRFCGRTKTSRRSQIGQAMPPPLGEVVGRSILHQMRAARGEGIS